MNSKLRNEINKKYQTEHINLSLRSKIINLTYVSNLDQLIEQITDADYTVDERFPYWAEIWPASVALAQFLLDDKQLFGKTVLELGSGLGLAGIAAAKAGARVTFSDYEQDALDFCLLNAKENKIDLFHTELLDWRIKKEIGTFDLILASDVLYEKRFHQPILNCLQYYLKTNGKMILSDPNRVASPDFFKLLSEQSIEFIKYREVISFKKLETKIDIYVIN